MNKPLRVSCRIIRLGGVLCAYERLWLGILVLALCGASWAEKGVLVVQVENIRKLPVAGVAIKVEGSPVIGRSDRFGRARIKLDAGAEVNDQVFIQIQAPAGRHLVLLSPWDERAQIPPFTNEIINFVRL